MNTQQTAPVIISEKDRQDIQQHFANFDTYKSGNVTNNDFRYVLSSYYKDRPSEYRTDLIEDELRQQPGNIDLWTAMRMINNIKWRGSNALYNDPVASSFNYAQPAPQQQFVQAPPAQPFSQNQPFYGQPNLSNMAQPSFAQPLPSGQSQPSSFSSFPSQPQQQFAQMPSSFYPPLSAQQPMTSSMPPQQSPTAVPTSAPFMPSNPYMQQQQQQQQQQQIPALPSFTPVAMPNQMTNQMNPMTNQVSNPFQPSSLSQLPLQPAYDPFMGNNAALQQQQLQQQPMTSSMPQQQMPTGLENILDQMQNSRISAPTQPASVAAAKPAAPINNPNGLAMPGNVKMPASIAKMAFVPPGASAPIPPPPPQNTAPAVKPAASSAFPMTKQASFPSQASNPFSTQQAQMPPPSLPRKDDIISAASIGRSGLQSPVSEMTVGAKLRSASFPTPAYMGAGAPPSALQNAPSAPVRVMPAGQPIARSGMKPMAMTSSTSATTATNNVTGHHYVSQEEKRAFVEYINSNPRLRDDPDMGSTLPINPNTDQLFQVVSEGALFCKLLNTIKPDLIVNSQIKLYPRNTFEKAENHNLAIAAARKLGCSVVNIGAEDLSQGKAHLVMGLLWQIIKHDVLSKVSLAQHPEIYKLASDTSNLKEVSDITPEEVLLKWANHHLKRANCGIALSNFASDLKNGAAYAVLMNQIAPDLCTLDALHEPDMMRRAQMIVENAKKLGCDRFISANDIVNGNNKLNMAFMADLFNKHSALELPTLEEMERMKQNNANNARMVGLLNEADARLRQILADGQLAYELQQQEIEEYRRYKLQQAKQLADQEAFAIAEQRKEELAVQNRRGGNAPAPRREEPPRREESRARSASDSRSNNPRSGSGWDSVPSGPASNSQNYRDTSIPVTNYNAPLPAQSGWNNQPNIYSSGSNSQGYANPPSASATTYDDHMKEHEARTSQAVMPVPIPGQGPVTSTTTTTTVIKKEAPPPALPQRLPPPDRDQARIPIVEEKKLGFFGRAGQKIDRTFH